MTVPTLSRAESSPLPSTETGVTKAACVLFSAALGLSICNKLMWGLTGGKPAGCVSRLCKAVCHSLATLHLRDVNLSSLARYLIIVVYVLRSV